MCAPPPPLPPGSLYYEVVEARLKEGLHFRGGGQTLRFGDSPQVGAAAEKLSQVIGAKERPEKQKSAGS